MLKAVKKSSKALKITLISFVSAVVLIAMMILASCNFPMELTKYVNVFAGNASVGHTSPCATTPFGMIKVGPESGNYDWKYCAGYQYNDKELYGFSQNRLNGTGCADLGDLHVFPYSGEWVKGDYRSFYDKDTEVGEPGYYAVHLDDAKVSAEMTCTPHVSLEKFTYDDPSNTNLMIDFQSGLTTSKKGFHKNVLSAQQNFVDPTHITGSTHIDSWVVRTYYYDIEFSAPYTVKEELPLRDPREKAHRYILSFDLSDGKPLSIKMSISATSIENAQNNIQAELPDWNFDKVRNSAKSSWNNVLNKVQIGGTDEQKQLFYSSMYRLFEQPENIGDAGKAPAYSTLSLWDTYRAAHPLYTILSPEYVNDFVNSMLDEYDREKHLPIWALWGIENWCMIGNHAVPVIVDAYLKGYNEFDAERAYQAIKTSLTVSHMNSNWEIYDKLGYFPIDQIKTDEDEVEGESVSRTLESAYDDYCAAQMAQKLGHEDDYNFFMKRANNYKNLFDPTNKLMRGKDSNGNWRTPFSGFDYYVSKDDDKTVKDFTEGNSWQYTWHVQQDVPGLIELFGGNEAFCQALDKFFTLDDDLDSKMRPSDVTGLIGQYAQGNEPSHHVAYLYTLAGQPWKTQELIHKIIKTQYNNGVDGLCGNEDCGQMSAWYIFSVLGFYPVNPCGGEYIIGAPQIPSARIDLGNGKTFTMKTNNFGGDNIYVESVSFNGKKITDWRIFHEDIMNGGELVFNMTNTPQK